MTEGADVTQKKPELKLFGEIDKRVAEMQEPGRALLVAALADRVPASEIGLIKQVIERYSDLTAKGQAYVDGTLGVVRGEAIEK